MGEEADILRDMISDRDKRIEKIKRKTEEQRDKELVLSKQLEEIGGQVRTQLAQHDKEKKELLKDYKKVAEKLGNMQRDFMQQGASLRKYCGPVREELKNDPSYVMRMQAQLCKAMHSMGINDHQFELVQKQTEAAIKYEKDQIAAAAEDKTHRELKLMNELMGFDTENRDIETEFTTELEKIAKEREALEHQIEENRGSDEESDAEDESEEEDEEEKEAKEEMLKILAERRTEIERLEKEQEEKEEAIAEMEEQLQEMQAAAAEMAERRKMDVEVKRNDSGDVEPLAGPPSSANAEEEEDEDEEVDGKPKLSGSESDDADDHGGASGDSDDQPEESSEKEEVHYNDEEKKEAASEATVDDENAEE